ncbi:uncharacterized protein LOC125178577 [Hyalella azteca]|uniref:Uncharacterized protein LOC125178577 n=1 Tax=Hyalella azteca TaxID=294128 RepID=A0A979FPL4_HYAAZ|nr:uncharacterized protein LOC125178577 [Hyalella azteca]
MEPEDDNTWSEMGAVFPLTELHSVCCVPGCRGVFETLHPSTVYNKRPSEISFLSTRPSDSPKASRISGRTRCEPKHFRRYDTVSCVVKSLHDSRSNSPQIMSNALRDHDADPSSRLLRPKDDEVPTLSQLSIEKVSRLVVQVLKAETPHETYKQVGTWLCRLQVGVDSVVWRVQQIRPPWLPVDLHWVEVEPDPLLLLLAYIPQLRTLSYTPLPHTLPTLSALLCGLPHLTRLQLRHTADDTMMRMVGRSCPSLQVLCVKGSRSVSDAGLRYMVLKPGASSRCAWRFLYRRWKELKPVLVSSQHQREYASLPPVPAVAAHQRTELAGALRHLDLRGTKVTMSGARWAAKCAPQAHLLLLSSSASHSLTSRTKRYHSLEEQQPDLFLLPPT